MSSVVISGDTSGAITLSAPAVAGTNTITLPAATGTVAVSGNTPAFSAYQNSSQTITGGVSTKVVFQAEEFDTANCFASNAFTPNVAGYYQVQAALQINTSFTTILLGIFKNGTLAKRLTYTASSSVTQVSGSALIYCNGTTDYLEVYAQVGATQAVDASADRTYFQACLVRTA